MDKRKKRIQKRRPNAGNDHALSSSSSSDSDSNSNDENINK
jgi:hypothetical protein